jgi:hypothetical protein
MGLGQNIYRLFYDESTSLSLSLFSSKKERVSSSSISSSKFLEVGSKEKFFC